MENPSWGCRRIADELQVKLGTTDALLTGERTNEPDAPIRNIRLLERFHLLDSIDRDEQETAIKVIDALIAKHRVKEAVGRRN